MIENPNVTKILYGGDYNPEQWGKDVWAEDMRILPLADIDILTLNVFSWALIQKDDETYDFSLLDEIIENVTAHGFKICLATSTAAHPAWMARKYPDILRVTKDGMRRNFGGRHNSCPCSPTYHRFAAEMARRIAERYKNYANIVAWHIANEFEAPCYCEKCAAAFREWLKTRYGTIEAVNRAWNCNFWSHTFYDFDEINPPSNLSEEWGWHRSTFSGLSIDYMRFQTEAVLSMYKTERDVIRSITPNIPITTNLMGTYWNLDYHVWADELDFISWDNYPSPNDPFTRTGMVHDLMRGLKQGKPFCLMEQTPSVTNWQPYNALKRPGVMRLISYQAVAHGADTVMFFQMRRSAGACEKFHGAVIDHCGHENTRVFREITALGKELTSLGDAILGSRFRSRVGIIYDWNNQWAVEYSAGPSSDTNYQAEVHKYYAAFAALGVTVDMISCKDDFSQYDIICAPLLYMIKPGVDQKLEQFAAAGGTVVTTFLSGIVNESDLVFGAYPGKLRNLCGIWVEEIDAQPDSVRNTLCVGSEWGSLEGEYPCKMLFEIIRPEGAQVIARYGSDFYAGEAAVTRNKFGEGQAVYVGSSVEGVFLEKLLGQLLEQHGITPIAAHSPSVEITQRFKGERTFTFLLNYANQSESVALPFAARDMLSGREYAAGEEIVLDVAGVAILES